MYLIDIHIIIDVPFTNGRYTHGKGSFSELYASAIQYDEGIFTL